MSGLRMTVVLALASLVLLPACSKAYYGAMEKFGYEKRDLLVKEVKGARDEQKEAKEQFKDALEQFTSVVTIEGGALEKVYNKLDGELQKSENRAKAVKERVREVERVAEDLFDEWDKELRQYSNASLREQSEARLRETRRRYGQLIMAMKQAEKRIEPVLTPMRDQVLFLKHNLNAKAIASIESELATIEVDVTHLVADMEAAIAEADRFLESMESEQTT